LGGKVAAPVKKTETNDRGNPLLTARHLLSAKVGTTSPTSGGRSVGIVRSRTKATEFSFYQLHRLFSVKLYENVILLYELKTSEESGVMAYFKVLSLHLSGRRQTRQSSRRERRVPAFSMCVQHLRSFYVEFDVLTAITVQSTIFRNVTTCSPVKVHRGGPTALICSVEE
jgi:hypothetical protein